MKRFIQPRLLPAIMTVGSLLLASKLLSFGLLLVPVSPALTASVVTPAIAAAPPKPEPAAAPPESATPAASPASEPALPPPPPVVSEAERQLLQDLRARRQELDARERTLAQREGVLDAAEQRLSARVAQLTALQASLEQLEAQRQQHAEAKWTGLVKVYETMKPRDAASIFNDMDMPTLLQVVDRMKDSKVAPILAAMLPDRARLVTTQLAAQRTRALEIPSGHPDAG